MCKDNFVWKVCFFNYVHFWPLYFNNKNVQYMDYMDTVLYLLNIYLNIGYIFYEQMTIYTVSKMLYSIQHYTMDKKPQ